MRNRHLRSTAVAQILDLVPSYLPGPAVSPHARELAAQHYLEPWQTMRESRCCSLPPESRFSLSISHSHPLSSLILLKVALFPLTASWVPPPASQLQCIARRRLVLARRRRLVPASLCNSPAHTLLTDDTISLSGSSTRHLSPAPPTTTSQHIVLSRFVLTSTCSPAQRIFNAMQLSHLPAAHIIVTPANQLPYLRQPPATRPQPRAAATVTKSV